MVLVAFWHGLRASEVTALTRDNVQDGFITVQRLKGSNKTVQQLFEHDSPLLNEKIAIFEFIRNLHGNQKLFPVHRSTFWRLLQKHAKAAGLPAHKRNVKMLKHSIATQTIHTIGIENVRQHLGHKSMSSTGEYLKVSDADASAAVARAVRS
jgi:integrase